MELWRLFYIFATLAILGTCSADETKGPQPKQINFINWLFGDNQNSNVSTKSPNVGTTTPSSLSTHSVSNWSEIEVTANMTFKKPASNGTMPTPNVTILTNGKSRAGKQMYPIGPGGYFPYPIYALPSPAFMNYQNFQNQKRRQRPIYNIYTEEEAMNSFETDGEEAKDVYYQEEEPMEDVVDDETLNKLRIPLKASQVDRISIEVDPASGSVASNEEEESSPIEDYDTSQKDGAELVTQTQLPGNEVGVGVGIARKRESRSLANPNAAKCADGLDCGHTSIFDQRRPASRGRIEGVGSNTPTPNNNNFTNIPILSLATTPASPSGNANATALPIGPTTVTPLNPGSSSTTGPIAAAPLSNMPNTSGEIPINPPILAMSNNVTTQLPLVSPSPPNTESTSMSSVASSYTPSQAPLMTTTVTSTSSITPGMSMSSASPTNNSPGNDSSMPMLPTMSAILSCQRGGSTLVRIMTHPWLVQILSQNKHLCAGSVINDRYILTAASCVDMYLRRNIRVLAGVQLRNPRVFSVTKVALHPKYDPTTFANNIALLRLSERIRPSRYMRPICLPLDQSPLPHSTAHLVTWLPSRIKGGEMKRNRNLQLLQTEVELLNSTECQTRVTTAVEGVQISNGTLCTSPPAQQKCGGDIGGVLQAYAGKYSYEQLGLVSLSVGCRANELPGIYTDVRHYLRWILFQTQDAHYCREPNAHGGRSSLE